MRRKSGGPGRRRPRRRRRARAEPHRPRGSVRRRTAPGSRAVARWEIARHRYRQERLGADAEAASEADIAHGRGELDLGTDRVADRGDVVGDPRGAAVQERAVHRPAEVLEGEPAETEARHEAHASVARQVARFANRNPQIGAGAERDLRVGLPDDARAQTDSRIAGDGAGRPDAVERGAAFVQHHRHAHRERHAIEQRARQVEVPVELAFNRRRRARGDEETVRVVNRQAAGEPARRGVPGVLDDGERITGRSRLEAVELVARRLREGRRRQRDGAHEADCDGPAESRRSEHRFYSSTETTNVVPRTPSTVRGVLTCTEPGCCRVSSPERTIIVPFLSCARRFPFRFLGSKK